MAWVVSAVAAAFEVGASAAVIATAVSEVGLATSLVGAVTGNKDLMKIGGIVGLAGGIGGLAVSAFGGAAAAAGDAAVAGARDAAAAGGRAATDAVGGAATDAVGGAATDAVGNAAADTGTQAYSVVQGAGEMPGSILSSAAPGDAGISGDLSAGAATQPSIASGTDPTAAAPGAGATGPASTAPAGANDPTMKYGQNNFGTDPAANSLGTGTSPAGSSDILNDGMPGPDKLQTSPGVINTAGTGNSMLDQLKAKLGPAWDNLPATAKAEMLKAALAIPGAIQTQNNKANELAIQQQKVNQTSFGSSAPRTRSAGILQRATAKG